MITRVTFTSYIPNDETKSSINNDNNRSNLKTITIKEFRKYRTLIYEEKKIFEYSIGIFDRINTKDKGRKEGKKERK